MDVIVKSFDQLTTAELYALLRLRTDVFVVEQACPYPELDGRDTEPTAGHAWVPGPDGTPLACLRILREPDAVRIGRVATAREARGRGLARALFQAALDRCPGVRVDIEAQTYLVDWYAGFGFEAVGEEFLDDGIPHVEMRREPR